MEKKVIIIIITIIIIIIIVRRVAANILNKQSWTTDKGWSSKLGVGRGADKSSL
jgi:hypothetical protein